MKFDLRSQIKIGRNTFLPKQIIKTEWLLQQNHRVGGMIEAPNQKRTPSIKDVDKKLAKNNLYRLLCYLFILKMVTKKPFLKI